MSEPIEVKVGQVWVSRDKREPDLRATVLRVEGDFAIIQRFIQSRVRLSTLRSRYRLVPS